ncbi:alginate lyase family protein [Clostridium tarantellae]|uniref:Heparinase n=1 Tax=Clostridium tarantellae TaxID=39493 RepID=A0A6I1MV50_9CLOT|nr:alginate lyase family protein [Clostridium tarantellae]MPQ44079.1 heparinase [Clostridium tarantellae]
MKNNIKEIININVLKLGDLNKKNFTENYLKFFRTRNDVNLYFNGIKELKYIVNYCKKNFINDINEVIRIANDLVNNTFKFEWKWDMERTFVPVTFREEIIWDKTPTDDEEWMFMINRHRFWITLGQAYALTEDEKYAKTFCEQIEHWIDNVPLKIGTDRSTWRTIDSGIRCENWIKAYMYFKDSKYFTDKLLEKFILSLEEHAKFLYDKFSDASRLSNWGVLENHGLLIVCLFIPELKNRDKYLKAAIERLTEQIEFQVMDDGMQWEQSPMYLNEVLHCYLDSIIIANKNNLSLPKIIIEKTKKLAYSDLYMAKPNHCQVCQSDSDDTDLRDILTKAAYIFKDSELKFGAYSLIDFESIWDLGFDSIEQYKKIQASKPKYTSYAFNDSGNYYMRSGWKEKDNYMYFHCGTLGSGHGHADLLHISIFGNGEDYLIDPGRYTYIEGNEYREYFKSCIAHNTILIDNIEFTVLNGSWGYKKAAMPIKYPFICKDNIDYIEGAHLGYMDLEKGGVFTNRKIIYIKPSIWIVVDEFYGKGIHNYKQYYHFSNNNIALENNSTLCIGKNGYMRMYHLDYVNRTLKTTPISYHYNLLEEATTLICSIDNEDFTSITTIIDVRCLNEHSNLKVEKLEVKNCSGRVLEKWEAEGIKIIDRENEYILLICHNDVFKGKKLLNVDGYNLYGKIVLVTKTPKGIQKEVIKY